MDALLTTGQRRLTGWLILLCFLSGCSQIRVPAIDPSGERIFLPCSESTTLASICPDGLTLPGCPDPAFVFPDSPPPCPELVGGTTAPQGIAPQGPSPGLTRIRDVTREGSLVLTPTKVIAPIDSDVVIFGGLCGADGYYRKRQRLEWTLSQESVGNFVEVREGHLSNLRRVLGGDAGKQGNDYAVGRTSSHREVIDRGTPTSIDDLVVHEGQGWVSVSSPSEGTSHVSCLAPKADGWDRRRKTATIHWVDAQWAFPNNSVAASQSEVELVTTIRRATTGEAISDWEVSYTILPGSVPSTVSPTGATQALGIRTDRSGESRIRVRQTPGQEGPGATQVRVDIARPGTHAGDPDRLQIASSVVTIQWTSPALTLVASGPDVAGIDEPYKYRLEISNPGDQVAPGVVATAILPRQLTLVGSSPQASFAGGTLSWNLGNLPPRQAPQIIELTVKPIGRGIIRPCFQLTSSDARLQRLEKCLETEVAVPCLGMTIDGPESAKVGDTITYRIRIQNQCQEPLTNIRLIDTYGEGLEAPGLQSPLEYNPFDLPPGGVSDPIELEFTVQKAGTICHLIQVTADGGHTAESRQCLNSTEIARPQLSIAIEGMPQQLTAGDRFLLRARVTNSGNTRLAETTVLFENSPTLRAQQATNGWLNVEQGLQWRLRETEPGESVALEVEYIAGEADPAAIVRVTAETDDGLQAQERSRTRIDPAAQPTQPNVENPNGGGERPAEGETRVPTPTRSNQLEVGVTAFNNPISLDDEATLIVRIKNDRNQSDRNVAVTMSIPEGLEYVGGRANDQIQHESTSADGRFVTMETRREMRTGDELVFHVRLRGVAAGKGNVVIEARSNLQPDGVSKSTELIVNFR